jgi:cytochrome P450
VLLLLLASGHDATGSQIGCSLFTLLQRNDIVRLAIAEPDLVPSIVAETIRLEPCADGVPRMVAAPLEICGEPQAAGTLVVLCTLTAHRDPAVWTDADELRPRRFMAAATPELLTFGAGAHHCLGAALARVTLTEAIRATIAHMPILLVDPDEIRWTTTVGRCPATLPVMM